MIHESQDKVSKLATKHCLTVQFVFCQPGLSTSVLAFTLFLGTKAGKFLSSWPVSPF